MYIEAMPETYDINELAHQTDTPVRTIRFWVAEGILPPPSGRGPCRWGWRRESFQQKPRFCWNAQPKRLC